MYAGAHAYEGLTLTVGVFLASSLVIGAEFLNLNQ